MIDDSGFRQIRIKVIAPSLEESPALLGRLFENPNVSTTLIAAGIIERRPFFEIDLFGPGSQVEEVLAHVSGTAGNAADAEPQPERAHA